MEGHARARNVAGAGRTLQCLQVLYLVAPTREGGGDGGREAGKTKVVPVQCCAVQSSMREIQGAA